MRTILAAALVLVALTTAMPARTATVGILLDTTPVALRAADGTRLAGRHAGAEGMDILHGRNGRRGDAELLVSF